MKTSSEKSRQAQQEKQWQKDVAPIHRGKTVAKNILSPSDIANAETKTKPTMADVVPHSPLPWNICPTYQGMLSGKWKGFPWSIEASNEFQTALIFGDGTLNAGTSQANATHIVQCVNERPSLLSQRDRLAYMLREVMEQIREYTVGPRKHFTLSEAHALLQEIAGGQSEGHSCTSGAETKQMG